MRVGAWSGGLLLEKLGVEKGSSCALDSSKRSSSRLRSLSPWLECKSASLSNASGVA